MVLDRSVFRCYRDDRLVCVDFDTDSIQSGLSSWRGDVDRSALQYTGLCCACIVGTEHSPTVVTCTMFQTGLSP